MRLNADTKIHKLFTSLSNGNVLTEAQIASRFKLKNPRATISDIREYGYEVNTTHQINSKGRKSTKYSMDKTAKVVA
jgi:hypothetical protein